MTNSGAPVRATGEAAAAIARSVQSYARQQEALLQRAEATISRHSDVARAELAARKTQLARAKDQEAGARLILGRCRENCGGLVQALGRAQRHVADCEAHLNRAVQAMAAIEQESKRLHHATRTWEQAARDHIRSTVSSCHEHMRRVAHYLGTWSLAQKVMLPLETAMVMFGAGNNLMPPSYDSEPPRPPAVVLQEMNEDLLKEQIDHLASWDQKLREDAADPRPGPDSAAG